VRGSRIFRLLSAAIALALAACAAEGPRFESASLSSSEVGVIYVYRPLESVIGRGEDPYVSIAGEHMGRLKAGGYVKKVVPIGEHAVTVRQTVLFIPTWPETVEVAVASGGSAYVKVDQRITSIGGENGAAATQQVFIEEVSFDVGQADISKARENM
jgi:hypothetical protein